MRSSSGPLRRRPWRAMSASLQRQRSALSGVAAGTRIGRGQQHELRRIDAPSGEPARSPRDRPRAAGAAPRASRARTPQSSSRNKTPAVGQHDLADPAAAGAADQAAGVIEWWGARNGRRCGQPLARGADEAVHAGHLDRLRATRAAAVSTARVGRASSCRCRAVRSAARCVHRRRRSRAPCTAWCCPRHRSDPPRAGRARRAGAGPARRDGAADPRRRRRARAQHCAGASTAMTSRPRQRRLVRACAGNRETWQPGSSVACATASVPRTARTAPSSASSPNSAMRSRAPPRTCPLAASTAQASARSSPGPALGTSPGARLAVMRRAGNSKPGVEDRGLDALARLSHRRVREPDDRERGQPGADVHLDRDLVGCCSPSIVNVCALASIVLLSPYGPGRAEQAERRLGWHARRPRWPACAMAPGDRCGRQGARGCRAATGRRGGARRSAAVEVMRVRPAGAGFRERDRVEAPAVDDHERVFGVRVDRDVPARPRFAVGLEARGVLRRAEQAAAVQRVGDRARAVIAVGDERAVPAAPDVWARRDFIGGGDHPRDDASSLPAVLLLPEPALRRRADAGRRGRRERALGLDPEQPPCRRADDAVGVSPCRACRRSTAASVAGPNSPSGVIFSAFCRRATALALPSPSSLPAPAVSRCRWRCSRRAGGCWCGRQRRRRAA